MQTTTTLNGRCTDGFDGTSAATPLVSGVMALALQAKYILIHSQGGLDTQHHNKAAFCEIWVYTIFKLATIDMLLVYREVNTQCV